jgi:hypothetical protein
MKGLFSGPLVRCLGFLLKLLEIRFIHRGHLIGPGPPGSQSRDSGFCSFYWQAEPYSPIHRVMSRTFIGCLCVSDTFFVAASLYNSDQLVYISLHLLCLVIHSLRGRS